MLRGLREASSNWLGKSIMIAAVGLLVFSFAIWGIADIFRGFGRQTLARIGNTEITIEQFRQLYNDRLQAVGRQIGRPITPEQARLLGVDRQIVRQIFSEFVLDEYVRKLRLGVTDAEIVRRITQDPTFQGANGQFDRDRFISLLRQNGLTEARYIADQRRGMLRRQLANTVVGPPIVPKAQIEAADRYQNEQRSIEYVLLDRAQAGEIPAPPPEALAEYFEQHKGQFRAPEYRKLVIISLIPSEYAHWITISDEELRKAFEERRSSYSTPERRQLQQIVFPNGDDARAASERIVKGESFDTIAKERGLTEKDIDLGLLTKAAVYDRNVADAAFALKEGEVSTPVQGRFGVVLVRVVKIEPEKVPAFEEVAEQLRRDLQLERAKTEVTNLYDKIEDERSLGKNLTEIANELKIEARPLEVDRGGRDPSNNPVANIPDQQRLLNAAFSAEIGSDNDPLQSNGGYIWYEISGITPERDRTLDEVKDQVEARWREDEVANRLRTKASQMLEKIKGGTSLADVAATDNLKVATKTEIKRSTPSSPLSDRTVEAIFRTAKDGFGNAVAEQSVEQIVFRVTDVVVPPVDFDSEATKQLKTTLNNGVSEDLFQQYETLIESEVGVTINEKALRQILSGQNPTDED
jgi:peptidyl-prolyl cis-trans isomerase D